MSECSSCEREIKEESPDDGFCKECYERIERMCKPTEMQKVEAAVFYINNCIPSRSHERAKLAAFLDIFHPGMDRRDKIMLLIEAGRRDR